MAADEPTLGEIFRGVADLKADVRAVRTEMLRSDVYAANRLGDEARIRAIEADLQQIRDERNATRKLLYGALATAAGSLVVNAVSAFASAH